jgi:hypothetical protein
MATDDTIGIDGDWYRRRERGAGSYAWRAAVYSGSLQQSLAFVSKQLTYNLKFGHFRKTREIAEVSPPGRWAPLEPALEPHPH